jgi:hypothetical protein
MLPSRRQALKGAGLLAGGGLLGGLGGSAAASTGTAGQVGTQSDRPDVFADTVNTVDLSTDRSWSDVTASRSLDSSFTNNSNSEKQVSVNLTVTGSNVRVIARGVVSGIENLPRVDTVTSGVVNLSFIVGVGESYKIESFGQTSDYSIRDWFERS